MEVRLAPFAAAASAQVKNIDQGDPEFPGETMSLEHAYAVAAAIQVAVRHAVFILFAVFDGVGNRKAGGRQ